MINGKNTATIVNHRHSQYLSLAPLLILLSSCTVNDSYHKGGIVENCTEELSESCQQAFYQGYENFDLAFAEYSERGNAFNRNHVEQVLNKIESVAESSADGIILVTFIHGWKHDAHPDDSNLKSFKKALHLAATEVPAISQSHRRLIGLFVGWRGASSRFEGIDTASFWDRKAVAEEVGRGSVTELLLNLDQIDFHNPNNVLIVIGHSFGGAITLSALTDVLMQRIVRISESSEYQNGGRPPIRGVGDLILILNPAIEANQSLLLVETARDHLYSDFQSPLFVSLSTDADWATHYTFPLGQIAGLYNWRQTDLERDYYFDRETGQDLVLKEEHLDTTTVGNFAPFLTHRLRYDPENGIQMNKCTEEGVRCEPMGMTSLDGHPAIKQIPENYPLYFIKTDDSVMTGHSDIFNPVVTSFVISLVEETVDDIIPGEMEMPAEIPGISDETRSESVETRPAAQAEESILNNNLKLQERFNKYFKTGYF